MPAPPTTSSWGSYLKWSLSIMAAVVAIAGLFNVLVDPLSVFNSPGIAHFNAVKPYLDHHRELARFVRAKRVCAQTGIFGNSRAEIGLDPQDPALIKRGDSAFNHAIPGSSITSSLTQMIWLESAKCLPKTLFVGVEFIDFLGGQPVGALPSPATHPAPRPDALFFGESVFSIQGLRDALVTVKMQRDPHPATLTDRGFNPLLNYTREVANSGHYILFRQRAEENLRNWSRKPARIRPRHGGPSQDEVALAEILQRYSRDGTSIHLMIYPYHAQIRLLIERLQMGAILADWKRLVVSIAERQSTAGGKVQVWDFSGLSPQTLEEIPVKGDRNTRLTYYWEAGHFKSALGHLMIDAMLGGSGGFGVRLDAGNIEAWLAEDRERVRTLLQSSAPITREVEDLFASSRVNR